MFTDNDVNIDEMESVNFMYLISMSFVSRGAGVTIIESSCPWRERAFKVSHRCSDIVTYR